MSGRDEMSRLLGAIRGDRAQVDAAALSGLSQAKISRAERGRFPFSPAEADHYARTLGSTAEQRGRLVELAEAKASAQVTGRVALVRVAAAIQERIERYHRESTLIRAWQPDLVPGVLQTPDYTAVMLAGDGAGEPGPEWWAARSARAALLAEPGRSWHLLISEAVLRWPLGSARLMAAQIDHLIAVSRWPTVRLGILDLSTPKPFAAPAAFHMYDRVVSVATEVGTSFVVDPQDVDHFEVLFARLDKFALHGDDARTLLGRLVERS